MLYSWFESRCESATTTDSNPSRSATYVRSHVARKKEDHGVPNIKGFGMSGWCITGHDDLCMREFNYFTCSCECHKGE